MVPNICVRMAIIIHADCLQVSVFLLQKQLADKFLLLFITIPYSRPVFTKLVINLVFLSTNNKSLITYYKNVSQFDVTRTGVCTLAHSGWLYHEYIVHV